MSGDCPPCFDTLTFLLYLRKKLGIEHVFITKGSKVRPHFKFSGLMSYCSYVTVEKVAIAKKSNKNEN